MGSSKSKSTITVENNTTIINRSDINILNKNLNQVTANVTKNSTQKCSNSVDVQNVIDFSNAVIEGDLNIGVLSKDNPCKVELDTKATSNFECINASDMQNDIGSAMIDHMMNNIDNKASNEALTKMIANADSKAETGFLGIGASSSSSNVNNINRYTQVTDNKKNLTNVMKNVIENNMTVNDVASCINEVRTKQGFDASGTLIKGKVNMCNFTSNVVVDSFGKCLNKSGTTSKITNDIAKSLGVTIKEDVESKQTTEQSGSAQSIATVSGVGDIFASLGSAFLGPFAIPLIISCSLACCCCIVIIVLGAAFMLLGQDPETKKQLISTVGNVALARQQAKYELKANGEGAEDGGEDGSEEESE